jgi:hypothetical protein
LSEVDSASLPTVGSDDNKSGQMSEKGIGKQGRATASRERPDLGVWGRGLGAISIAEVGKRVGKEKRHRGWFL